MRLKNERPRLSKTVDDVVATIRMTLRNHANKFDEFWRIWRSIQSAIDIRCIDHRSTYHQWSKAVDRWSKAVDGQKLSMVESCRSMIKSCRLMSIDDQKQSINLSLIYDSFGVP